jgi:hypothetical protein
MHKMEELKEMLCEELEKITKKGELSAGSLDVVDKLTHSIKSIDTIMAMEDAGYSNESGYSYARGDGRGRGRNARRDSMGRYSNNRDGSYDDMSYRNDNRDYSRKDAKEELAMDLRELKRDAKDPETAQMINRWIKQLEQD